MKKNTEETTEGRYLTLYDLQINVASLVSGIIIGLDVKEIVSSTAIELGFGWLSLLPAFFVFYVVWAVFNGVGQIVGSFIAKALKIDESYKTFSMLLVYYVPILLIIVAVYFLSLGLNYIR
jgi:hypothetical protein